MADDLRSRISDTLVYKFGISLDQSKLMADTLIRNCGLSLDSGRASG